MNKTNLSIKQFKFHSGKKFIFHYILHFLKTIFSSTKFLFLLYAHL